ncbi:MAG: CRISPR-associated endonuclease Cas2 [Clostridium sp.]
MSYRYMRVIVFFDLPNVSYAEHKEYTRFRKFLINEGFIMMQESIYTKLAINSSSAKLIQEKVKKNKTKKGIIQMMVITEKQFSGIEFIVGGGQSTVIDSTSRFIVL